MIGAASAAPLALPNRATPSLGLRSPTRPSHALSPCSDPAAYHKKLARVLDRMGALYTVGDLLTAITEGRMLSFVAGNSWAIAQLNTYPRARVLQLVAMVGHLEDVDALHAKLLDYASDANVGLISTYGRLGWIPQARRLGWRLKARSFLFHKEM